MPNYESNLDVVEPRSTFEILLSRRIPPLKRSPILLLLVVVSITAIACGTDDGPASAGDDVATRTVPTAPQSPTPIPTRTPTPAPQPTRTIGPQRSTPPVDSTATPPSTASPLFKQALNFEISVYQAAGVLSEVTASFDELLNGEKPIVVNFFGGFVPPSRADMPLIEASWQEFGDEVNVVGIDVGPFFRLGDFEDGMNLAQEIGVTYPIGGTDDIGVLDNFGLNSMPSTYFILPDGTIFDIWPGAISAGQLRHRISSLIEASTDQG